MSAHARDESELLLEQRRRIEHVRAQNRELDFELRQDRKQQAILKEPLLNSDIKNCKTEIENYLRKNRQEELFIKETAQTIRSISTRLQAQQRSRGGEHVTRYNNGLLSKQANILQSRLDVGMVKYNKKIETNVKLREQIDRMVQQREVFDKIYSRIAAEVTLISDETTRLNQQIELVEKERNAVAEEMDRQVAEAEKAAAEFDRKVVQDGEGRKQKEQKLRREKAKLKPDTTEVVEDDEHSSGGEDGPEGKDKAAAKKPKVGGMTPAEEENLITSHAVGKWTTVTNKTVINHARLDLSSIQQFFDQLYDATGITDVDELSKLFLESERRIFSVFRDINAVTEEIDAVQQEVTELEAAQSKHNPNRQQNLLHRRAVLKTKQTLQRAEQYERRFGATRKELALLEAEIVAMRNELVATGDDDIVQSVAKAGVNGNDANAADSAATTDSLTMSIMKSLGQIEQQMREADGGRGPGSPLASSSKGNFSNEDMLDSRKKIAEVTKVVKKRLNHDSIFRDDFSDSDDELDEYAGAGGLLPHSELKTKRLVKRHFQLAKSSPHDSPKH